MHPKQRWNPYFYQTKRQARKRRADWRQLLQCARENKRKQMIMPSSREGSTWGCGWWQDWQSARDRRRLRRVLQRTAVGFGEQYPEWQELFFDTHFLLNRGLPIIERHLRQAMATDGMDLALAWAEQLPQMPPRQRKCHLLALTPLATEFLHLVADELTQPGSASGADGRTRQRIGVPADYVQAHRSDSTNQMQDYDKAQLREVST